MAYVSFIERLGIEKGHLVGRQEGLHEGKAALLTHLLTRKFNTIDTNFQKKIELADEQKLLLWGERILDAKTLQEVFEEE